MSTCAVCREFPTLTALSGVVACTGCLRPEDTCDCLVETFELIPAKKKTPAKGKK